MDDLLTEGLSESIPLDEIDIPKLALAAQDIKDVDGSLLVSIKDPKWRDHEMTIEGAFEVRGNRSAFGVGFELIDPMKNSPRQPGGSLRLVQGNIIGNGIEILERWLRPNYLSHRDILFLAWR